MEPAPASTRKITFQAGHPVTAGHTRLSLGSQAGRLTPLRPEMDPWTILVVRRDSGWAGVP